MKTPKAFLGRWRFTKTEAWNFEDLERFGPPEIAFDAGGLGGFRLIAVQADIDCRFDGARVDFSWNGTDDGEPTNGRGWAMLTDADTLDGRIYFHQGDDSGFTAVREASSPPKKPNPKPKR